MREIGDGTRRFFRTKGKPTPVKRISSRRIVARFFHPELVAFINLPLLHSVFIQDERFDKTENLHDVNPSPPSPRSLIIGFQVFPSARFVGYLFVQKNVRT